MPNLDTIANSSVTVLYTTSVTGANSTGTDKLSTTAHRFDTAGCGGVEFLTVIGEAEVNLTSSLYVRLRLEHSDDGTTWANVTDASMVTLGENVSTPNSTTGYYATIDEDSTPAIDDDEKIYRIGYVGDKRYVRPQLNAVGDFSTGTLPVVIAARATHLRKAGNA